MTWWACLVSEMTYYVSSGTLNSTNSTQLVRVRCAAFKNESATPEDATSASVSADVQPEPSKRSPRVFHRAISVCKPPSITTCTLSPWVSGHFHCTDLANANRGWSNVVTGICPGFKYSIALLWTSMPCLIMAGVADLS